MKKTLTGWRDLVGAFFRPAVKTLGPIGPQLVLLGSTVSYVVSVTFDWLVDFQSLMLMGGAGGYFTWLTKSALFRQVLREEVINAHLTPKYLRQQTVEALQEQHWRVIAALGVSEEVAKLAHRSVMERLWRPDKPFFYRYIVRVHTLKWIDEEMGLVDVHTRYKSTVVNTHPGSEVVIGQRLFPILGSDQPEPKLLRCLAKEKSTANIIASVEGFSRDDHADQPVFSAVLKVPGDHVEFDLDVEWTYCKNIDEDSVISYECQSFCESYMEVEVLYETEEMKVSFETIGPLTMVDSRLTDVPIQKKSEGLIMPWNGYILSIQRLKSRCDKEQRSS